MQCTYGVKILSYKKTQDLRNIVMDTKRELRSSPQLLTEISFRRGKYLTRYELSK